MSILFALFAFALMVMIHELGHFTVAKLSGIEVKEFAIGFGKILFSKKYGETIYSLRAIPLGGFNDINLEDVESEKCFAKKPFLIRFLTLFAGSAFNLVSAFVVLVIMASCWGIPTMSNIIDVRQGYVAEQYLQNDDKIISFNGYNIDNAEKSFSEISKSIAEATVLDMVIERNGELKNVTINKDANTPLGITFRSEYLPQPFDKSVYASALAYRNICISMYDAVSDIFTKQDVNPTEQLAGPIGVTQAFTKATDNMGAYGFLFTFVLVSINLGFVNLLPIPVLDGGHICIQAIEAVIGRPLPQKDLVTYIGISIIGFIFVLGMYGDISRLIR